MTLRIPRRPDVLVYTLLVALAAAVPVAHAQVLYGSLVGNVTDSTGAAMPGATVTIEQAETQLKRELVTDSAGAYHFTAVPSGTYTISVTMTGFRTVSRRNVPVTLNSVARVDAKLEVGQLTETVMVTGETPILQTDRAEVRAELKARELTELPVPIGRNYQQLFKTLPGFTPPADAHSIPSNPSRALVFNVNGASDSSNNTRIDGVSTDERLAAARGRLRAGARIARDGERRHQQLRRRAGTGRRLGDQRADQERHEPDERVRVRVPQQREDARAQLLHAGQHAERGLGVRPVRRHAGRPDPAQQAVLLRQLRRHAGQAERHPHDLGADRGAAPRRPLRRRSNPIYDPATGNADGTGRTPFAGNIIPAGSHRPDRAEDHRPDAAAEPAGRDQQLLRRGAVRVQPVDARHEGELERHAEAEHLRPLQPPRFLDVQRDGLRRQLQGIPIAGGNPGTGRATRTTSRPAPPTRFRRPSWPTRTSATCGCPPTSSTPTSARTRAWICSGIPGRTVPARSKAACRSSISTPTRTSA